jgi:hypothetical protein
MNKTKHKTIRKNKPNTKTKKMTGGQIVEYSTYDYNIFFAPIDIPIYAPGYDRMDCVANVFFGLGYCTAENAQYLAQETPYGLEAPEIIELIEQAYEGRHQFVEIDDFTELNDILPYSGIATVACMSFMEDGIRYRKHCVGLLREENPDDGEDYYYVIDFQNEQILMIDYYMWHYGYNDLLVIDSDTVLNMHEQANYGRITEDIIDNILL